MTSGLHTLVGAYALDALTIEEHAQFQQHLATCAACRAELVELQATAARLSDLAWEQPPAQMRERLMGAVQQTPQDRPWPMVVQRGPWRRWAPGALAVAAALSVILSLGAFLVERNRVSEMEQQQSAVAAVLSAPDVRERRARLDDGGSVRILMAPSLDQAVVAMQDLPPLDESRSYQLWRIHPGGPESEAVMPADASDPAIELVSDLGDTESIAVTVEPAGGSPLPTTEPIVNIELT